MAGESKESSPHSEPNSEPTSSDVRFQRLTEAKQAIQDMAATAGISSGVDADAMSQQIEAIAGYIVDASPNPSFGGVILFHNGQSFEVLELLTTSHLALKQQ